MYARHQKAWLWLIGLLASAVYAACAAELHTWTFAQDGQMQTSAGGTVSFKKKGRLEAALVRLDTTNAVLLARHGEYLTIPAISLCDDDRSYLARASGIEEGDAAWSGQSALVKNEMSRRRVEAAKLRDEAESKRRLAQIELDAAERLDNDAAALCIRAGTFAIEAEGGEATADKINLSRNSSHVVGMTYAKTKDAAAIAAGAADQLQEDIATFRRQAREKRQKAANLQKEATALEQTAQSEEANAMGRPLVHQ